MTDLRKIPKRKPIDHARLVIERTYQMREERGHQGKWRVIIFLKNGTTKYSCNLFDTEQMATESISELKKIIGVSYPFHVKVVDLNGDFWFWDNEYSHAIAMPAARKT